jgi:hypothetical protein
VFVVFVIFAVVFLLFFSFFFRFVHLWCKQLALKLWPANGKAASQLALMALKRNALVDAVLYYGRALVVAQPILTARDSLTSLFERIRLRLAKEPPTVFADLLATSGLSSHATQLPAKFEEATSKAPAGGDIWLSPFAGLPNALSDVLSLASPPNAVVSAAVSEPTLLDKETTARCLQAFELRFLALHGLLYTGVGLEQFPVLRAQVDTLLVLLLLQRALSAPHVLQLLMVNLFAVFDREAASKGAPSAALTAAVELACSFMVAFMQLPLSLANPDAPEWAAVAVFLDWFVLHYPRLCSLDGLAPAWVALFGLLQPYLVSLLEAVYSCNWVDVLPDVACAVEGTDRPAEDPYRLPLAAMTLAHSVAPLWEDVLVRGFEPLSATSTWHDRLHAGVLSGDVVLQGHMRVARILGAVVTLTATPFTPFVLAVSPNTQQWSVWAREVAVAPEPEMDETIANSMLDVASMTRTDVLEQLVQLLESDDLGLAPARMSKVAEFLAEQPAPVVRECLESTSARYAATAGVCQAIIGGLRVRA